ncbi:MAG: type II secretion system F family protein [Planctomycetes bacterium]|nr:type II secretion system F family protein [Planctomycetota bacterium]
MFTIIVILAAFVGVAALVAGVAMMFRGESDSKVEDRLAMLTAQGGRGPVREADKPNLLIQPLDEMPGVLEMFFSRFGNLRLFLEQADTKLSPSKFFITSGGIGGGSALLCFLSPLPIFVAPLVGLTLGMIPFLYLFLRRRRRINAFARQLPEALELLGRALRAGHSLGAGFNLVASEMGQPIRKEFLTAYEEQNFGIPLEEALEGMTERVPNLDLRFFATAVILQRQTGGDLAEILDKIGRLVRERFQIWGQVQALTGEGRLSGIVLLALPPALFLAILWLNPDYVMALFTDPLGKKMLAAAIVFQLLGAVVIRKIVNIKV